MESLLLPRWNEEISRSELRFLLLELIGGHGQVDPSDRRRRTFCLPCAGSACQVKLVFGSNKDIKSIERGEAFDEAIWQTIVAEINGPHRREIGRAYSFSGKRVDGSWFGPRSFVQILPPPPTAPVADLEVAEHPFILEFPLKGSTRSSITAFRRANCHRALTALLDVLLSTRVATQLLRPRHFWAYEPDANPSCRWLQESYFGPLEPAIISAPTSSTARGMDVVDANQYHLQAGYDGRSLEVPSDLDDSICAYWSLSREERQRFDRAAFWMDMSARQWNLSASASFASLAVAVEVLADRRDGAPTRRFTKFLERYAPGEILEPQRKAMYDLRSDILHGSVLMEMDQDFGIDWSPPAHNELSQVRDLRPLVRVALRNWLKVKGSNRPENFRFSPVAAGL